jgi:hypothetical protein
MKLAIIASIFFGGIILATNAPLEGDAIAPVIGVLMLIGSVAAHLYFSGEPEKEYPSRWMNVFIGIMMILRLHDEPFFLWAGILIIAVVAFRVISEKYDIHI